MKERGEGYGGKRAGTHADFILLLKLRLRHARSAAARAMHLFGTDPTRDTGVFDRIYILYVLAFVLVAAAASWAAVLNGAASAGAQMGAAAASATALVAALPLAALAYETIANVRTPVVKLTHPDIAFVAASSLSQRAIALDQLAARVPKDVAVGALVGWLAGAFIAGGAGAAGALGTPFGIALTLALALAAATCVSFCAGVAHLASSVPRTAARIAASAGALIGALALAALVFALPSAELQGTLTAPACPAALAAIAAGAAAAALALAPRMSRSRIIQENALHADLAVLNAALGEPSLDPSNAVALDELRRKRKLAERKPWLHLPHVQGAPLLLARSALSMARQPEGLGYLLMQGGAWVPLGIAALTSGNIPLLLLWTMMTVAWQQGARELSRTFRDYMAYRQMRDLTPFGTLPALLLSGAPALVVVLVAAAAVLAAGTLAAPALLAGMDAPAPANVDSAILAAATAAAPDVAATAAATAIPAALPFALGTLLCLAPLLAAGLNFVPTPNVPARRARLTLDADVGMLIFVLVTGALALGGQPAAATLAAAALCILAALVVHRADAP